MPQVSLFVSITSVIFATAAIILVGIYRENHASKQLQQLGSSVAQVQVQTQSITDNIASTNANLPILIAKNETFNQCIVDGNNWCSNITTSFEEYQSNLTNVYTVESLNISYIETTTECSQNTALLKMMVTMFNPGTANVPVLLQNGNTQVSIGGDMVLALYEVYRLRMAQDQLDIYYMVIQPWSLSITSGPTVDPTIQYSAFSPAISSCTNGGISLGRHKILGVQASLFSPGSLTVYGYEMFCNGNINFATQGTINMGDTVQLTGNLMILIN